jgi:ribosome-binding protein aMBF1 (putative translation factor)
MDSIIKFGQFVRHQRQQKGLSQLQLSLKVFNKPNMEYIGRLERGVAGGITFTTADKILWALDSEMGFKMLEKFVPDFHR